MKQQAIDNREKIAQIQNLLRSGDISYDEAKALAQPVIKTINAKSAEVAKKYNKTPSKLSFSVIMR